MGGSPVIQSTQKRRGMLEVGVDDGNVLRLRDAHASHDGCFQSSRARNARLTVVQPDVKRGRSQSNRGSLDDKRSVVIAIIDEDNLRPHSVKGFPQRIEQWHDIVTLVSSRDHY